MTLLGHHRKALQKTIFDLLYHCGVFREAYFIKCYIPDFHVPKHLGLNLF